MNAKSLMLQGTGSNVGKSVLVAGLCRVARNRGLRVAPFKPQNMSNNAAVCADGGEIGRAQQLQARACGLAAQVEFNPVLLKPQSDQQSQIIVNGKVRGLYEAKQFMGKERLSLLPEVMNSFESLRQTYDLIFIEGAGSPAETNLRRGDIANMGFANAADVPVSLIADIERGGVIASLIGTNTVLDKTDRARIKSFIVNKFRGDPTLFEAGVDDIKNHTGWQSYGVVPWLPEIKNLPEEDAVPLEDTRMMISEDNESGFNRSNRTIKIVAPMLSRIANFDDLDPLRREPNVEVIFVPPGKPIPLDADAVVLLGTKSALEETRFLKAQGWDIDILALARGGVRVLGICGGLQMLGNTLKDGLGVDGKAGDELGLGLLNVNTTMQNRKTVRESQGQHLATGSIINGYEIHVGETLGEDAKRPFAETQHGSDGAMTASGQIAGTYLHGIFNSDSFRGAWLNQIRSGHSSVLAFEQSIEDSLDQLANSLETYLDIDQLLSDAQ